MQVILPFAPYVSVSTLKAGAVGINYSISNALTKAIEAEYAIARRILLCRYCMFQVAFDEASYIQRPARPCPRHQPYRAASTAS